MLNLVPIEYPSLNGSNTCITFLFLLQVLICSQTVNSVFGCIPPFYDCMQNVND